MKPALIAVLPLGVLFATAALSRLHAASLDKTTSATYIRESDALKLYPRLIRTAQTTPLGHLPFQTAEREALRLLRERLTGGADTPSPVTSPVSVTWTDDYRKFQIPHRALYDPAHNLLYYQTRTNRPSVYDGVTIPGMEAALKSDSDAPFATAHTFSYGSMAELVKTEED